MLKIKCPSCNTITQIEEVVVNAIISTTVRDAYEYEIDYEDDMETFDGYVDRYQCKSCGFVLKDEYDHNITYSEDLLEWLENNVDKIIK
jgi:transposase-like protein